MSDALHVVLNRSRSFPKTLHQHPVVSVGWEDGEFLF